MQYKIFLKYNDLRDTALLELEKGNFKATIIQAVIAAFDKSNSMMKDANQ